MAESKADNDNGDGNVRKRERERERETDRERQRQKERERKSDETMTKPRAQMAISCYKERKTFDCTARRQRLTENQRKEERFKKK